MNIKLPVYLITGLLLMAGFFVALTPKVFAVSIAEQTGVWSDELNVWRTIQELGNNLSGTAQSFTFRISTATANLNQFDFTAENTRIYDKDNSNSNIIGCVPSGTNPLDPLRGLTFTTESVPSGFENVTIDFSCRNYNFIPGHRYLILITNANRPQYGGKRIKFATSAYGAGGHGGSDRFNGGGFRYAFDNGSCNAATYIWNSQTANSGCNIFTSAADDLYFALNNNSPPPKIPVIFIPGIGGSEMKATQDIFWSATDGHGGTYSHAYTGNEKIWVNQDKAAELGNDDYFDILKLKEDGVTSEADLSLTGNLTSFGYSDIDSFFTDMGYVKGTNFFVFPYDWRKDVRSTRDSLDALIETAKTTSGQSKVNLVVHSMGGLVARYYISDAAKAAKVNMLIELGVPHLGAPSALKALLYGEPVGRWYFKIINIGVNGNEVKDVLQNFPAHHSLIPSSKYYEFYNNTTNDYPYPFKDDRDIDNNQITGALNYSNVKNLLTNLSYNMTVFGFAEALHSNLDINYSQSNNVKIYEITGSSEPTLGQLHETWWITWPINLINKRDEIFINGDGTVPLYSASLKNDSLDISGATKIYYVEQKHSDLVSNNGTAMQTVRALLNNDNSLPVEVKDEKIYLEGEQISLDDGELDLYDEEDRHCGLNSNGEMEENIPDVSCTTSGNTKHAFVKKKAAKVKVKGTLKSPATTSKKTTVKKRTYWQDKISKTTVYKNIALDDKGKIEFDLDPTVDTAPTITLYPDSNQPATTTINPTSQVSGGPATDQTPPTTTVSLSGTQDSSGNYTGPVTVTLTGNDAGAGVWQIEYSTNNGQTVQTYTGPFTVSNSGTTTVHIMATDNTGNEEIPQTITIQIAAQPTPTPSSASTTSGSSSNSSSSSTSTANTANTPGVGFDSPGVNTTDSSTQTASSLSAPQSNNPNILGLTFEKPSHVSDQINVSGLLDQQKRLTPSKRNPVDQILGGLLMVSGGIITFAFLCLIATLLKPIPKQVDYPKP